MNTFQGWIFFRGEYFPGLNIFQGWIFFRNFFSEYGVIYYDSVSDTDEFLIRSHQTAQSAHCALVLDWVTIWNNMWIGPILIFRTITQHARWSSSDRLCLPGTLLCRPKVFYDLILSIECIPGIRQASPTSPASFAPHLFANSLRRKHTQHTHSLWKRANTNVN